MVTLFSLTAQFGHRTGTRFINYVEIMRALLLQISFLSQYFMLTYVICFIFNGFFFKTFINKPESIGAPGWHSRLSVRLQPGHDLTVRELEPRVRLWADGSEPGACFRFCVSLSLSAPPPFMLCLSLSPPPQK